MNFVGSCWRTPRFTEASNHPSRDRSWPARRSFPGRILPPTRLLIPFLYIHYKYITGRFILVATVALLFHAVWGTTLSKLNRRILPLKTASEATSQGDVSRWKHVQPANFEARWLGGLVFESAANFSRKFRGVNSNPSAPANFLVVLRRTAPTQIGTDQAFVARSAVRRASFSCPTLLEPVATGSKLERCNYISGRIK